MDISSIDEAEVRSLVIRAQKGSTEAFGKLYDLYFEAIYRYVAFRLPADVVEDLVADIFVKAWEKLHTYKVRRKVPFGAWLFRIARNAVVDTHRSRKQWEEVPEHMEDTDTFNRTENRVTQKHVLKNVRGAMDRLPSRYREGLQLSYIADLPHDEIAKVMRTSEGSVRILKHRALRKLETLLPPDSEPQV